MITATLQTATRTMIQKQSTTSVSTTMITITSHSRAVSLGESDESTKMMTRPDGVEATMIGAGLYLITIAQERNPPAATIARLTATATPTAMKDARAENQPTTPPVRRALSLDERPFAERFRR